MACLPALDALVAPLLGAPYAQWNCWALCRHLIQEGLGIDLDGNPEQAQSLVAEVWYQGDRRPVETVVQPWDLVVIASDGVVSDSVGLAVDTQVFVHTHLALGVCLERLPRWHRKVLQLGRLRSLL